jgi:hypothetical protein
MGHGSTHLICVRSALFFPLVFPAVARRESPKFTVLPLLQH